MTKNIWNLRLRILNAARYAHCDLRRLDDMGRLRPLRAIGNLEFYLLSCTKRFKAISHNSRKVNKHIVSTRLLDETIPLLCVKPFHNPFCCQDRCPPFLNGLYSGI
jgi:hypothetical protein